jgi:hypothetical protein
MNLKQRVLSQLGQDNATFLDGISNPEDVFSRGYWEALSLLPPRLILSNLHPPINPESLVTNTDPDTSLPADFNLDEKRELLVFRTAANHIMDGATLSTVRFITKPCKRISLENSKRSLDTESIYFATDNSPVYWYENVAGVQLIKTAPITTGWTNTGADAYMPNGSSALQVYAIKRHIFTSTEVGTGTGALEDFPLPDSYGVQQTHKTLPEELEGLVIKKIAHSFLVEIIANAAVQEEDSELVTVLSSEAQILSEMIQTEVGQLSEKFGEN